MAEKERSAKGEIDCSGRPMAHGSLHVARVYATFLKREVTDLCLEIHTST